MRQASFGRDYLLEELERLSSVSQSSLTLFIIGGGAMIFYGLKSTTKDVDVVLRDQDELSLFIAALTRLNYSPIGFEMITPACKEMRTQQIMENEDGFRWDIFYRQVSNALTLSDAMMKRATRLYSIGNVTVLSASKEDIFLFKSITERETDLDDMRFLAESGLNWETVEKECQSQSTSTGRLWENALYERLLDLKERYRIQSPLEKNLRRTIEQKLILMSLEAALRKGNTTIKLMSQSMGEPEHFIRRIVKQYEERGLLLVDRSKRPYSINIVAGSPKQEPDS